MNQDYYLEPENAASEGEAILGLQMGYTSSYGSTNFSSMRQFEIVARWGRSDEVPGDVYQAILQKAALIVLTQVENLQSIASISQDGFSKGFDTVGIVTQKDLVTLVWGKTFDSTAARWKRPPVF